MKLFERFSLVFKLNTGGEAVEVEKEEGGVNIIPPSHTNL